MYLNCSYKNKDKLLNDLLGINMPLGNTAEFIKTNTGKLFAI